MRFRLIIATVLAILSGMAVTGWQGAAAAPAGAASGLSVIEASCPGDGTVQATIRWTASGRGQQWADLAVANDNFSSSYSRGGPYAASANRVLFTQMTEGREYHARVVTQDGSSSTYLISDTLTFTARCPGGSDGRDADSGIAPPVQPVAFATTNTSAYFQWTAGAENIWYCLNTATSAADLQAGGPSWRNHGCWSTGTSLSVDGLACGVTYYWNVYAWNHTASATSGTATLQMPACGGFTSPGDLDEVAVGTTSAQLTWSAGLNNRWYCVYLATNVKDLLDEGATLNVQGCWSSQTFFQVTGLACGTTYYWNVHAWSPEGSAISPLNWFETDSCGSDLQPAPIDGLYISKEGGEYIVHVVAGLPNGCNSPGTHEVTRSGGVIDIAVLNRVAASSFCTLIYGTYMLDINLGSDFVAGQAYEVNVNEERTFFVAN